MAVRSVLVRIISTAPLACSGGNPGRVDGTTSVAVDDARVVVEAIVAPEVDGADEAEL